MKTVAVIIPTFNRWPDICSAIDSVLNQSYQKTECIVVDDASTDSTVDLLNDKYGNNISIVSSSTNRGQSFCRNLGVTSCNSEYICFLDSDDILEREAVELRISLFSENRNDALVVFGVFRTVGEKTNTLLNQKKRWDELLLTEYLEQISWCNNNGFLINREIFISDGMYDPRLRNKEDVELLLRLLSQHPFYYCGAEIGEVRDVCGSDRARNNHKGVVEQGVLFSDIVFGNPLLRNALSNSEMKKVICSDTEEVLRSLYKLERYSVYRSFYKECIQLGRVRNVRRFFQRFLLSYVKELPRKLFNLGRESCKHEK